ncbi:MAG: hypothetical protein HDS65_03695 [Bacteroidales bacterium]|nr:hypothetical protein [Bacteroidales bacterium]
MKRLYGILLAAILGLGFAAAAQDAEATYPITFNVPDGIIERVYYWDASESRYIYFYPPIETVMELPADALVKLDLDNVNWGISRALVNNTNMISGATTFGQMTFFLEGPTTITIEAIDLSSTTTDYIIYAENMEGVKLRTAYLLTDEGEPLDAGEGYDIRGELPKLGYGYEFDPEKTKMYVVPVTNKYGKVWVSPAEGWYIQTVQTIEEDELSVVGILTTPNAPTSYIIAKKFENDGQMTVNLIGDKSCTVMSRNPTFGMWQNPYNGIRIHQGSQTVDFVEGMNLVDGVPSFEFYIPAAGSTGVVYLNGIECPLTVNGDTGEPVEGRFVVDYVASTPAPVVTVYTGKNTAQFGTLTIEGDPDAKILSTPMAYTEDSPWRFCTAAPVEVQLSDPGYLAVFNGDVVEADSEGKLTLTLVKGTNTLEIDPAGVAGVVAGETAGVEYFNLQGIRVQTPAKGATYIKRQGSAVSKVIF